MMARSHCSHSIHSFGLCFDLLQPHPQLAMVTQTVVFSLARSQSESWCVVECLAVDVAPSNDKHAPRNRATTLVIGLTLYASLWKLLLLTN